MQPCSGEMQGPNNNSLFNGNNNSSNNEQQIQFDAASNDDFLKQMLSNLPSSPWTLDPKPNPNPLWDPNSDETTPENNVLYPYDLQQANLASKFRNHHITDDKASALMLQHHQLLLSSAAAAAAANSPLLQMPVSSLNDVVHAPSFKSPTPVSFFI